ncbi:hypothetical protein NKDENANG_02151 [Candidatus Entotheonellaceae bacterium PAL068K]
MPISTSRMRAILAHPTGFCLTTRPATPQGWQPFDDRCSRHPIDGYVYCHHGRENHLDPLPRVPREVRHVEMPLAAAGCDAGLRAMRRCSRKRTLFMLWDKGVSLVERWERGRKRREVVWPNVALVLLLIGITAVPGWAVDPMLLEAQRTLKRLGHDPGMADGIYGPRTQQALEAFQRQIKIPVTGLLDAATLWALEQATAPPADPVTSEPRQEDAPLWVVLHCLRLYAYQPARLLPYVTERFRHGLPPRAWIKQTMQTLSAQEQVYLGWQVQRLEVAATRATVEIATRVRLQGQEQTRLEVFTLVYAVPAGWLLDSWQVEAAPTNQDLSQTDS